MRGAIAGDVVGSYWQAHRARSKSRLLLTPSSTHTEVSVLSVALAQWALGDRAGSPASAMAEAVESYPANYDIDLITCLSSGIGGTSDDDGAASRVAVCGWVASDLDEVRFLADQASCSTHDDASALLAAQSVAMAIFLGRQGRSPQQIAMILKDQFVLGFADLDKTIRDLASTPFYTRKASISVPVAVVCALRASSVTEAIRNVVSLGGDSSRQAAIAGAVAEAVHGIDDIEFMPALRQAARISPAGERLVKEISDLLHYIPRAKKRLGSRLRMRRLR